MKLIVSPLDIPSRKGGKYARVGPTVTSWLVCARLVLASKRSEAMAVV